MVNLMLMLVLSLKEPPSVIVDVDKLEAASRQRTCTCAGGFVECGLGVGRGRGSRQLRCNKPGWRRQVVVVPTVLKGINNQRMRLVSDIVGSILIGAAVELPPVLATRRACHFDVSCYQRYEPILPIWEVFNRNATLAALEEAGACVVEPQQGGRRIQSVHIRLAQGEVLPLRKPIGASKLERFATHNMLVGSDSLPDSLRRISFGGPSCCVLFVPDTIRARQLFRRVNAAFITSPALRLIAHTALSHFRDTIGGQPQDEPPYSTLALHWRAETDMSNSSHALSSHAFRSSVKHALRLQHAQARGSQNASRMHNRPLTQVLVLGDQNATDAIHKQLRSPAWLRIHSKTTLLGSSAIRRMLPAGLAEMDDAVGMVDFEIGLQVDRFIGAPFSSFSVMIALARVAAVNASCVTPRCRRERHADDSGTLMLNGTDTVDQLAAIFAVAFPYTAHIPFDPCGDLVQLHPAFGKARGKASGLFKCPMRTFTVSRIDLDRPEACFCGPTNFCESLLQSQRGFVPADEWDQCQPLPSFDGLCDNLAAKHLMKFRHTPQQALLAVSEVDVWQQLVPPSLLAQINAPPLSRGPSSEDRHHSLCPELAPRFVFDPPLDLGCHLVVATATFGAREPVGGLDLADVVELKQDESKEHVESCFFAFVDEEAALATLASGTQQQQPQLQSHQQQQVGQASYRLVPFGGWTLVVLSKAMLPFEDYNRNSRIPKMLMHMAFSHATYAMYLDAKLRFRKGSLALLWRFVSARFTGKEPEWDLRQPRPIPVWVSPKHDKRASAYDEARCVIALDLIPADAAQRQMDAYAAAGFPKGTGPGTPGLIEGMWHLRDLRSADQARLGCAWLREFVLRGHTRDQLSFNFVAWQLGLLPTQPGPGSRTLFSPPSPPHLQALFYPHMSEGRAEENTKRGRVGSPTVEACKTAHAPGRAGLRGRVGPAEHPMTAKERAKQEAKKEAKKAKKEAKKKAKEKASSPAAAAAHDAAAPPPTAANAHATD